MSKDCKLRSQQDPGVSDCTKNYRAILLKIPSQNIQVSITFLWHRSWEIWNGTAHLEENPEMCVTQPPAGSVLLPAIHWFLSNKTADKHSRASSGTEPCHWQEGEINEHPRGNQVWSCLFLKTCKNVGASWIWMLDKASTWSAQSGKMLGPAGPIFMVIHHHIFHGSEDKVSLLKIPESEKTVKENGYFPMEVNAT